MIPRLVRNTTITMAAGALLAGCAAGPGPFGPRYQTPIPEGSTLVLQQALALPTGEARVFMQEGRIVQGGTNRFQLNCSFGLERVEDEPLIETIQPDRFRTGPARNRAYVDARPEQGVQVAGVSFGIGIGINIDPRRRGGANTGYLTYVLEIPVRSPRQPQVDDFSCQVDRPGTWRGRLGLEAIQQATGDIVRVEFAESDTDTEPEGGY